LNTKFLRPTLNVTRWEWQFWISRKRKDAGNWKRKH